MGFAGSIVRPDIAQFPAQSLREYVAYYFVSNFVLFPPNGTDGGHFDFIIPFIRLRKPSPHFKLAFEACALAYFSNRVHNAAHLAQDALVLYTKALSTTSQVLTNCDESEQNGTIAAVLLLGLFENITSRSPDLIAWSNHTQAAIQLVKRRGQKQLNTDLGRSIFSAVRSQQVSAIFTAVAYVLFSRLIRLDYPWAYF